MLWGTDSIWYGSPQDQIDAFRAFQISAELREKYGYAELTPALKRKVFGLNAREGVLARRKRRCKSTCRATRSIGRAPRMPARRTRCSPRTAPRPRQEWLDLVLIRARAWCRAREPVPTHCPSRASTRVTIAHRLDPRRNPYPWPIPSRPATTKCPTSTRHFRRRTRIASRRSAGCSACAARASKPAACWNWVARAATTSIPMALGLPNARFIGIDLSARQIEQGQRQVSALGLTNIELRQYNIADVDASWGKFDYIISHGIYSWVPAPVREKLLAICRENLAANGIAYVSYNTLPGWRMRGMIRDMMIYHTARFCRRHRKSEAGPRASRFPRPERADEQPLRHDAPAGGGLDPQRARCVPVPRAPRGTQPRRLFSRVRRRREAPRPRVSRRGRS